MAELVNQTYFDPQAAAAAINAQHKAEQSDTNDTVDQTGEQIRRAAEKKLLNKLQEVQRQQQAPQKETFSHDDGVQKRWQQALDGRLGPDVAATAMGWANNGELQQKLTDAQKRLFQEAMVSDPPRAVAGGESLLRLTQQPGFEKAVPSSQQMGTLQAELLANPRLEKPVAEMLQSRFMQANNADATSKDDFMRFGMQQATRGNLAAVKTAGDMLGVLTKTNTPRLAQRAAMNMVQRNPANTEGMKNVDNFVQHPAVQQLPTFARGTATTLLAKADGRTEVREGFEKLAGDPTFRTQSRDIKGRFFSTIGSGRPTEYRALTDKTLQALQNSQFPTREAQVSRFLTKMGAQVSRGGAAGVNVKGLIKASKGSPLPPVPALTSTEGLSDEDAQKVRAQNRAKVIQYYNQVSRAYDGVGKRLQSARYFEHVNVLPSLRDAEELDASGLAPEDQVFIAAKNKQLKARYTSLKKIQQQRMRELRSSRISPQQQRAMQLRSRAQGQQSRYFNPRQARGGGRVAMSFPVPGQARGLGRQPQMPETQGLPVNMAQARVTAPRTPMQGQRSAVGKRQRVEQGETQSTELSADEILANLPTNASTQERLHRAKQIMAKQWEQQMKEVMSRVLGEGLEEGPGLDEPMGPEPSLPNGGQSDVEAQAPSTKRQRTQGKTDGWGIPRTFERDLGAADRAAVRPATGQGLPDEGESAAAAEKYTGRALVRPASDVRDAGALFNVSWKKMNKAEAALLRNLGWNQQAWDTRNEPAARWPQTMRTRFGKLSATQRESVRKLGLSADDWDAYVSSLTGKGSAA